jgi:tripartite-type tricarboxylate transporter receptor subunit TctC
VPNVLDLAKSELDRKAMELLLAQTEMGRPILAPGQTPADRLKVLQTAFSKAMKDKAFLAEAAKQRLAVDPLSGPEVKALMDRIYKSSSPEVVDRAKALTALSFKEKKK